jgi:alpha-D-xyloside xylohydrolase
LLPRQASAWIYGVECIFVAASAIAGNAAEKPAYQRNATSVTIPVNGADIILRPMEDGAIRVQIVAPGVAASMASVILVNAAAVTHFSVRQTNEAITVDAGALQATVDRRSGALHFADAAGKLLFEEQPGSRVLPAAGAPAEGAKAEDAFVSPSDEALFGMGQFQDGYLDVRGLPRRLTQVNSQIAIPFLLSSRGYGLLWHNYGMTDLNPADTAIHLTRASVGETQSADVTTSSGTQTEQTQEAAFTGEFEAKDGGQYAMMLDVGQKMAQRYHVEIDGKAEVDFANRWLPPTTSWLSTLSAGRHSVRVIGEAKDQPVLFLRPSNDLTTLRSANAKYIDYVVFAGPKSDDVIRRYRDLTGAAPMMPDWAYGYIHCRERFHSQEELLDTLKEFREKQFPLDVIVQDWQYWGRYGWNAMQFDEKDYPDPRAMTDQIHDMHARLMVSVWSRIDPSSAIGKEFKDKNYYIPGTDWVDFFNPAAANLYWKDMSARLLSLGIDAWWQDATEPENDDLHGRTIATGSGDSVRLLYPLFVNKTVYEGQRQDAPDKRVFILTRSAFSGQQRYASATWSGDVGSGWDTLRREITAGLDFSASGLPYWTTDTGGFFRPGASQYTDTAYHERLLRWLEFSTFTPLMRVHGYQTDTEFWRFGLEVESVARKYLDLRYQMLPYLYSEAAAVTKHGSTLLRPLVMDFADDAKALKQNYEFMFGHEMLVAPVVTPSTERMNIYLPHTAHGWFSFWTGERVPGGVSLMTDAKVDEIPVFVPAGSILPFGPVVQYISPKRGGAVELRVYPGADAIFDLYDDEGTNYDYEHGICSTIKLQWNDNKHELIIGKRKGSFPGMATEREFLVQLIGSAERQQAVKYEGRELHVLLK